MNPLLLAVAAAAAYPLYLLGRRAGGTILAGIGLIIISAFLVLPGGRSLTDAAQSLPQRLQRAECIGEAITHGAPVSESAALESSSCAFHGRGFPPSSNKGEAELRLDEILVLTPAG